MQDKKFPPILNTIREHYYRHHGHLTTDLNDELKKFSDKYCEGKKDCNRCICECENILGYNFHKKWCLITLLNTHTDNRDIVIYELKQFLSKNKTTKKLNKTEVSKMETKSMIKTVKKTANIASILSIFVVAFVLAVYKILKTDGLFEYDLRLRDWSKNLLGKMEALIKLIK